MSPIRILAASCLVTTFALAQTTHLVPAQFPTIQQAVDAAVAGDTVLVDPGDYIENVLIAKAIVVKSVAGAGQTFITANPASTERVVDVEEGATLEGFTVRQGRGVLALSPSVLRACIIRDHVETGLTVGRGFTPDTIVVVDGCVIRNNTGKHGTDPLPADLFGVGGAWVGGECYFVNTVIADNRGGDGVYHGHPFYFFERGGIGGVFVVGSMSRFYNCTIVGNVSGHGSYPPNPGGIVWLGEGVVFSNSICWFNSHPNAGPKPYNNDECFFSHCNVEGLSGPSFMSIDAAPEFVDRSAGDYRLQATSPSIDSAFPGELYGGFYPTDIAGRPRVVGGRMDMGAHEFVAPLAGTVDAPALTTTVAGSGSELEAKVALPGQDLVAELSDDSAALAGAVPVLMGQVFLEGSPPVGLPGSSFHLDPFQTAVLYDGQAQAGPLIGSTPIVFGPVAVPPGLSGLVLRLQGFGLTPLAANGFYAATDAVDHHFVD